MSLETLFTCPRCAIPNFSATGLHRHHCRAAGRDYERRRLTLLEISQAQPSAPVVSAPSAPSAPSAFQNSEKGGAS